MATLMHHLAMLEKSGHIKVKTDGWYKHFYPMDIKVREEFQMKHTQERIFNAVRENPGIFQKDIAKKIGESKQVVNYHIKILQRVGLIELHEEG